MKPVARTKSPNCKLLTAWHAIAKVETVTERTGPSPSSGKRRSFDPIVKQPPIEGLQRRGMEVALGTICLSAAQEPPIPP